MVLVGRGLKDHLVPTPLPLAVTPPKKAAQSPIQTGVEVPGTELSLKYSMIYQIRHGRGIMAYTGRNARKDLQFSSCAMHWRGIPKKDV